MLNTVYDAIIVISFIVMYKWLMRPQQGSSQKIIDRSNFSKGKKIAFKIALLLGFVIIDLILTQNQFFMKLNESLGLSNAPQMSSKDISSAIKQRDLMTYIFLLISADILTPIWEEIAFRGVFYDFAKGTAKQFLGKRVILYRVVVGILAVGNILFFAWGHETIAMISASMCAIMTITLFEFTGSIAFGIALHIIHNSTNDLIVIFKSLFG